MALEILIEFCFACSVRLAEVSSGKATWDTSRSDLPRGLCILLGTIPDDITMNGRLLSTTLFPPPKKKTPHLQLRSLFLIVLILIIIAKSAGS